VVSHVLNALTCFQELHGNRVTESMHRAPFNARLFGVVGERGLDLAFLSGSLPASEEPMAHILAYTQVGAQQFGIVAPERFLAARAGFEPLDPDVQIFQVYTFQGEQCGFLHPQTIVVNQGKEHSVSR
jgi:hypothetical protein